MQFLKRGAMHVVQRNSTVVSHPGAGCLISASDPYDAIYRTKAQAFYLELPREPFLARFPAGALPPPNTILRTGSGSGGGRVLRHTGQGKRRPSTLCQRQSG
jgi:hypothetical protein